MYCKLKICQETRSHVEHSSHFFFKKKDSTGMEVNDLSFRNVACMFIQCLSSSLHTLGSLALATPVIISLE